ncbi:hypothetical protein FKP32DRAFT_1297072 [Trametes sanguinea]|nr:hypothetical protein FKP32DRAFT_1297072 [Trametes sanguinea]
MKFRPRSRRRPDSKCSLANGALQRTHRIYGRSCRSTPVSTPPHLNLCRSSSVERRTPDHQSRRAPSQLLRDEATSQSRCKIRFRYTARLLTQLQNNCSAPALNHSCKAIINTPNAWLCIVPVAEIATLLSHRQPMREPWGVYHWAIQSQSKRACEIIGSLSRAWAGYCLACGASRVAL